MRRCWRPIEDGHGIQLQGLAGQKCVRTSVWGPPDLVPLLFILSPPNPMGLRRLGVIPTLPWCALPSAARREYKSTIDTENVEGVAS